MFNCCCTPASCTLTIQATVASLCASNYYGVWESSYGAYSNAVSSTTIAITNSSGTTVSNGSSQPPGTYTVTITTPTFCVTVSPYTGGPTLSACIYYGSTTTYSINHVCPDTTHTLAAPAMASWSMALNTVSDCTNDSEYCPANPGLSGTLTTGSGQTIDIPSFSLLNSNGDSLTITGDYATTGECCCSTGVGTGVIYSDINVDGSVSFNFCNGPIQDLTLYCNCCSGGGTVSTGVPTGFVAGAGITPEMLQMALQKTPIPTASNKGCGCGKGQNAQESARREKLKQEAIRRALNK